VPALMHIDFRPRGFFLMKDDFDWNPARILLSPPPLSGPTRFLPGHYFIFSSFTTPGLAQSVLNDLQQPLSGLASSSDSFGDFHRCPSLCFFVTPEPFVRFRYCLTWGAVDSRSSPLSFFDPPSTMGMSHVNLLPRFFDHSI